MPTIEELAEGPRLELLHIPIADIEFDPANPNEMTDEAYETLTVEIRDHGFTQPVAVWRRPDGSFRMIDGEHRCRVLKDLGATVVPAVVDAGSSSEDEARIRLVAMNNIHGQFVPIKLAYLLKDLASRIDERELRRRMGFSADEFRDTLRLTEFGDQVRERLQTTVQREAKEAPSVLKFVCSQKDAAAIERAVDRLVEGKVDRGQALARICREWEKHRKAQ